MDNQNHQSESAQAVPGAVDLRSLLELGAQKMKEDLEAKHKKELEALRSQFKAQLEFQKSLLEGQKKALLGGFKAVARERICHFCKDQHVNVLHCSTTGRYCSQKCEDAARNKPQNLK